MEKKTLSYKLLDSLATQLVLIIYGNQQSNALNKSDETDVQYKPECVLASTNNQPQDPLQSSILPLSEMAHSLGSSGPTTFQVDNYMVTRELVILNTCG